MATQGTKLALLLGLFMAVSLLAAAQPDGWDRRSVTIRNPALLALDIMNDDTNVRVVTAAATLVINHEEQRLQISAGGGEDKEVNVHEGDVVTVMPDRDAGNPQAFKIVMGGEGPRPDIANMETPPATYARKVLPASYNIPIPEVPLPHVRTADLPHANEPWPEMRP